jgi:hypothetical protein
MNDDERDDQDEVGAMQGAPVGQVSPTWTWGSVQRIHIESVSGGPAVFVTSNSQQLMQVSLPEPAVCSIYFQVNLTASNPLNNITQFSVNLNEGVGRVTVIRDLTYLGQPALNSPLEVTLPFVPVHALNVDVTAIANIGAPNSSVDIEITMVISPLTRIPQEIQKLQFGMAMPGEADDLDDELRQDLEAEGPTAAEAVAEGRVRVDGSNDHVREQEPDDDEPDDDDGPQVGVHPVLVQLIEQLTARHGRRPTKPELRAAVQRYQARVRRRRARGRGRQ